MAAPLLCVAKALRPLLVRSLGPVSRARLTALAANLHLPVPVPVLCQVQVGSVADW
jgi:hypothetical protein